MHEEVIDPFAGSTVLGVAARQPRPTEHIVHFYGDETFFLQELTDYVVEALRGTEAAVVIATPDHRREIDARLTSRGVPMDQVRAEGRYLEADAQRTLAKFVIDGRIDPARFADTAGGLVLGAMGFRGTRPVRAFGEMVALLCYEGRYDLAKELESLWVALARRLSFSLLCAYPTGLFREERNAEDLGAISKLHERVVRSGHPAPLDDAAVAD